MDEVSFVRSRRAILDRVSWRMGSRDHWVVLGGNGSGKTTLLQLLAGYLWPSSGQVTVLGQRFGQTDLRELRKSIGWVGSFLGAQFPPSQRPLDLIVSGRLASIGIYEPPREEDYGRARDLACRLGCEHILDSPYSVLSQGEKQRLLIARALVHDPCLLILDEPCAGLDLVAREHLLRSLVELGSDPAGPAMILVTHHLEEIVPVFENVLLLKNGRCLAQGPKEVVLTPEILGNAFGIPIQVGRHGDRYWAWMEGPRPAS
ncbi:MAG: ABC transporter ATP-binding protein [Syntrophobacteraceae bacterium]|nr:ABC transporter ATP-binding protein [Syntrophobacteraceae bacterium]